MSQCATFGAAIGDEFAGRLATGRRAALRAHVRTCAACRAAWDRAAAAERVALGSGHLDRAWSYLSAQAAPPAPRRVDRLAWGVALAASAAGVLLLVAPAAMQSRGGDGPSAEASLRLLRVVAGADGIEVRDIGTQPRVAPDERLVPLITNLSDAPRWVTLWVTVDDGAATAIGAPERIGPGVEDERWRAIHVDPAWAGRTVAVWAVFDSEALTEVRPPEGGLVSGDRSGVSIRKLALCVERGKP